MVQRPRPHRHEPRRRHEPRSSPDDSTREHAETIQGLRAGLALLARRRDDVLRVAYSRAVRAEVGDLARWAASRRIPCEEVSEGELDRIAGSQHHEGLCVLARPRRWLSTNELADVLSRTRGTALALDRVRNPYNVGAILRSAAFFGVDAALLGAPAPHPGLAPTAVRVAEGGAEHVQLARTTDLADTLGRLRAAGARVIGADGHATTNARGFDFGRPAILVVGNEREGLGDRIRAQCDGVVAVRGSGAVESLNVAVAAGVLLSEMTRR
jgi:TrmH RNA methyltransferase